MNQDFSKNIRALENVTLNRIKHEWWNRNVARDTSYLSR